MLSLRKVKRLAGDFRLARRIGKWKVQLNLVRSFCLLKNRILFRVFTDNINFFPKKTGLLKILFPLRLTMNVKKSLEFQSKRRAIKKKKLSKRQTWKTYRYKTRFPLPVSKSIRSQDSTVAKIENYRWDFCHYHKRTEGKTKRELSLSFDNFLIVTGNFLDFNKALTVAAFSKVQILRS